MTNYTKITNFANKDSLTPGDANKKVKGAEIDAEFNAIASASSTKADTASPTFTGTPAAPTAATGTNTTQIATTAFVQTELVAKPRIVSYNHVRKATNSTSTSTTAFDLGMTVTMTPASASNKLLIFATTHVENLGTGDDAGSEFKIYLDGSEVVEVTQAFYASSSSVTDAGIEGTLNIVYEYSPADTSEVEIALYGNAIYGGTTHTFFADVSSLTVLEIEP